MIKNYDECLKVIEEALEKLNQVEVTVQKAYKQGYMSSVKYEYLCHDIMLKRFILESQKELALMNVNHAEG